MRRIGLRTATVAISFALAAEIALRLYNPLPFRVRGDRIILPVHVSYTFRHAGATKLDPITRVTKNALGFRGPDPPRDWSQWLTVLAIGGSTTECWILSDGHAWTDQLARRASALNSRVWVNNAGLTGHSTYGHLVLLRQYVTQLRPTIALFLIGINDLTLGRLNREASPEDRALTPDNLSRAHRLLTFAADHSEIVAVMENFARFARAARGSLGDIELPFTTLPPRVIDDSVRMQMLDQHRTHALPSYAARVRELVALSRSNGIEPVLMTQPALYGEGLDPTTGLNLATIAIGTKSNGRVEWELLELYNGVTRQVGAETGAQIIDLAREMPKDSRYFYDWVHFTNEGAQLVGDLVYRHLEDRFRQ